MGDVWRDVRGVRLLLVFSALLTAFVLRASWRRHAASREIRDHRVRRRASVAADLALADRNERYAG